MRKKKSGRKAGLWKNAASRRKRLKRLKQSRRLKNVQRQRIMQEEKLNQQDAKLHSDMYQSTSKRKKIFVCSPYRPISHDVEDVKREREENVKRVRLACRQIVSLGHMPMCPHGYFTQFLDDDDKTEREQGLKLAREWLAESDELWIFGKRISEGMATEIAVAHAMDIPVIWKLEPEVRIKTLWD